MNKNPKYSVGCSVVYQDENGTRNQGIVFRIAEVGRECFSYTVECKDGKMCFLSETKIIECGKK